MHSLPSGRTSLARLLLRHKIQDAPAGGPLDLALQKLVTRVADPRRPIHHWLTNRVCYGPGQAKAFSATVELQLAAPSVRCSSPPNRIAVRRRRIRRVASVHEPTSHSWAVTNGSSGRSRAASNSRWSAGSGCLLYCAEGLRVPRPLCDLFEIGFLCPCRDGVEAAVNMPVHQSFHLPLDLLIRELRVGQDHVRQRRTNAFD